jgi:hypothetical protein
MAMLFGCGECPKCGAALTYPVGAELKDDTCEYRAKCPDCGWIGIEVHRLEFAGYCDKDGNPVPQKGRGA